MSLRKKYGKLLSTLVPGGAIGVSLLLGSAVPGFANQHPAEAGPAASEMPSVSERLTAVRDAVSDLAATGLDPERAERQLAWWNWRNGGWRNGGWRNGGWRNGGWRNWWHNW